MPMGACRPSAMAVIDALGLQDQLYGVTCTCDEVRTVPRGKAQLAVQRGSVRQRAR